MTPSLPQSFITTPLAHRGYHDVAEGRPENSRAAARAAIEAGYGIELDLQLSADGQAMVFHDYDLGRLTGRSGPTRQHTQAELGALPLKDGGETIPTLRQILDLVAGRVPVLIELKDQDGGMGPDVGPLEEAAAREVRRYQGPVAVMSFNPHSVALLGKLAPDVPRGLTTSAYDPKDWPLSASTCDRLREIPDIDRTGAAFISHEVTDLNRERVKSLRANGMPVLAWTVTSQDMEDRVRALCDNVTFEGYPARLSP